MKKNITLQLVVFAGILAPALAFADTNRDLKGFVTDVVLVYLNIGIQVIMAFALVVFVYNVVKLFIVNSEAEKSTANTYVLYSAIGFFVIVSVWGLVNILIKTFDLSSTRPAIPTITGSSNTQQGYPTGSSQPAPLIGQDGTLPGYPDTRN